MPGARPFEPRFFETHPLFWPIAPAASAFVGETDWPAPASYARAFRRDASPLVRFESAAAPGRRRRRQLDPHALYDARISTGWVPTRERSWHDFLNALVWATFPRAKRALHARQLRVLGACIEPGARRLPPRRSREHDALALVDEGGVVVLDDGRERVPVLFGHALYEGLVLRRGAMTACAVTAHLDRVPEAAAERT
ncbi:MAG TPA: DUF3025 domain-containing protein, partial [Polyangiaceae bacterium]